MITETTNNTEEVLYHYYDNNGVKYSTGNYTFANARALFYGTLNVFVDKK